MDYRIIREARLRWPFRPFFLKTTGGRTIFVQEPEHFAVSSRSVVVIDTKTEDVVPLAPDDVESLSYADEKSETPDGP